MFNRSSSTEALRGGRSFEDMIRNVDAFYGMLSTFSIEVMDSILSFQSNQNVSGALIEFGVLKGRSAALIGHHVRSGEQFLLVDIENNLDSETLTAICPGFEFVLSSSENFRKKFPRYPELRGKCRFIHIDSGHFYRATYSELQLADELLGPRGVVVLDDFTNLNFSQILAATYKYLYTAPTRLMMFLVTGEKAYLCRREDYDSYGRYVLYRLLDDMVARGEAKPCLARTDNDPEYRAFHLRPMMPGETERYYGLKLFKRYYRRP